MYEWLVDFGAECNAQSICFLSSLGTAKTVGLQREVRGGWGGGGCCDESIPISDLQMLADLHPLPNPNPNYALNRRIKQDRTLIHLI